VTLWNPTTGAYAYATRNAWRDVKVGQVVRYGDEDWLVVDLGASRSR
jgi:hypothetical protein